MKKLRTEDHPAGGTLNFFELPDGRHASILDDEFPFADDFEIQLRDGTDEVIPGTEHREPSMKAAIAYLEQLVPEAS